MGLFCLPKSDDPVGWLDNALANLSLYERSVPDETDVDQRRLDYLLGFIRHDIERTLESLKQTN